MYVSIDVDGRATVNGVGALRSGSGSLPRILWAGSGTAQCADVDGDGLGGLARVEITFKDARSGEVVIAIIVPRDGDVSTSGRFAATVLVPSLGLSIPTEIGVHYSRNRRPG